MFYYGLFQLFSPFACDGFPAAAAVFAGGGGSAGQSGTNFLSGARPTAARSATIDSVSLLTPPDTEPAKLGLSHPQDR